jgi:hypothetical protein
MSYVAPPPPSTYFFLIRILTTIRTLYIHISVLAIHPPLPSHSFLSGPHTPQSARPAPLRPLPRLQPDSHAPRKSRPLMFHLPLPEELISVSCRSCGTSPTLSCMWLRRPGDATAVWRLWLCVLRRVQKSLLQYRTRRLRRRRRPDSILCLPCRSRYVSFYSVCVFFWVSGFSKDGGSIRISAA